MIAECLKLLTDDNIKFIAQKVAEECNKSPDNLTVKQLKKAIREADTAIEIYGEVLSKVNLFQC